MLILKLVLNYNQCKKSVLPNIKSLFGEENQIKIKGLLLRTKHKNTFTWTMARIIVN